LPPKQDEKDTESPQTKPRISYTAKTIYFLPNKDVRQSKVFFYAEGPVLTQEKAPYLSAFNQYFNGGFGGLVLNEIREKNSLAYTAYGQFVKPLRNGEPCFFIGGVGTLNEKVQDVLALYLNLMENMPQIPERMPTLREYIQKTALTRKPSFRTASETYETYKRWGYSEDPAKSLLPVIDRMSFDDIVRFYSENLKGKPVAIGIVGDPKIIDLKALEKYGKVVRLGTEDLFK
jgi:zinc protease